MRVTVNDILQHIALDLRFDSAIHRHAALEAFITGNIFDLHIAITTDLEETELRFLERYGHGHTYYFRLVDYAHGRDLAMQLFRLIRRLEPDMSRYTGSGFGADDKLYLIVFIRQLAPVHDELLLN